MSKDDIEKAVKDAEMHAAEDKKLKENVEIRNNAENLVFQCEKTLADTGDKLSEDDKAPVKAAMDTLKETLKTEDYDRIKADTEALTQALYKIGEKLYQSPNPGDPGAGAAGGQQNAGGQDENGYYNADFRDASDDKK
jgi:molecular chaperone DnaK